MCTSHFLAQYALLQQRREISFEINVIKFVGVKRSKRLWIIYILIVKYICKLQIIIVNSELYTLTVDDKCMQTVEY